MATALSRLLKLDSKCYKGKGDCLFPGGMFFKKRYFYLSTCLVLSSFIMFPSPMILLWLIIDKPGWDRACLGEQGWGGGVKTIMSLVKITRFKTHCSYKIETLIYSSDIWGLLHFLEHEWTYWRNMSDSKLLLLKIENQVEEKEMWEVLLFILKSSFYTLLLIIGHFILHFDFKLFTPWFFYRLIDCWVFYAVLLIRC